MTKAGKSVRLSNTVVAEQVSAGVFSEYGHLPRTIQRGATKLRDSKCLPRSPLALFLVRHLGL
jgi:hypothetical protein